MALRIDKLRFRNVLVRGEVPEAAAIDFADALDDTFREQLEGVATKQDVHGVEGMVTSAVADIKADAAEREARTARHQQVLLGIIAAGFLTLLAMGVAILLAVLL